MSSLEASVDALPAQPLAAAAPPPHTVPSAMASPPPDDREGESETTTNGLLPKGKKTLRLGSKDSPQPSTTQPTKSPTSLPSPPLTVSPPCQRASPLPSPSLRPVGASPQRRIRSSSPGLHSPASSLIFERNVQDPEPSADVPAHIKTDDFIPPALDASSLAITDTHLGPDEVQIVMHAAHQPASAAVTANLCESLHSPGGVADEVALSTHAVAGGEMVTGGGGEVAAATATTAEDYGSLDTSDPRRLSFISFADVVQAEHVEQDRHEQLGASSIISSGSSSAGGGGGGASEPVQFLSLASQANGLPSPVRSPASLREQAGSRSGRTSGAASPGSPTRAMYGEGGSALLGVEAPLQIETMRQALRKTHSGDLGGGL